MTRSRDVPALTAMLTRQECQVMQLNMRGAVEQGGRPSPKHYRRHHQGPSAPHLGKSLSSTIASCSQGWQRKKWSQWSDDGAEAGNSWLVFVPGGLVIGRVRLRRLDFPGYHEG